MKFTIPDISDQPVTLFRRAGYQFQRKEGTEMSFVRPLAAGGYPRFHAYAKVNRSDLEISFHLDQKRDTYGDETRHHGEYEEFGALKIEADRIKSSLTVIDPDFNPV